MNELFSLPGSLHSNVSFSYLVASGFYFRRAYRGCDEVYFRMKDLLKDVKLKNAGFKTNPFLLLKGE